MKSEISIKLGYNIKPNSPISVTVGDDEFELFAQDDRAYVADATQELKMIEAMKKGSKLVGEGHVHPRYADGRHLFAAGSRTSPASRRDGLPVITIQRTFSGLRSCT